jgi:hypothetical protein
LELLIEWSKNKELKFPVIIIEGGGALPIVKFENQLSNIDINISLEKIIFDQIPVINCDVVGGYENPGIFISNNNILLNQKLENYIEIEKNYLDYYKNSLANSAFIYVDTDKFILYFTIQNEKLILFAVDLRKPCEA